MNFSRTKYSYEEIYSYNFGFIFARGSHSRGVRVIRRILAHISMPRAGWPYLVSRYLVEELAVASNGSWRCKFISTTAVHRGGSFRARRSYNSLMLSNEPYSRKRGSRFLPFWSGWAHPSFRSRRELRFVSCRFVKENGIPLEHSSGPFPDA